MPSEICRQATADPIDPMALTREDLELLEYLIRLDWPVAEAIHAICNLGRVETGWRSDPTPQAAAEWRPAPATSPSNSLTRCPGHDRG